ncbi:MAG: hypothetical protein KGM43_06215 [Planctomycetota bacterium]|nr:hypothetical protein [Planctomycetota bacterium]
MVASPGYVCPECRKVVVDPADSASEFCRRCLFRGPAGYTVAWYRADMLAARVVVVAGELALVIAALSRLGPFATARASGLNRLCGALRVTTNAAVGRLAAPFGVNFATADFAAQNRACGWILAALASVIFLARGHILKRLGDWRVAEIELALVLLVVYYLYYTLMRPLAG